MGNGNIKTRLGISIGINNEYEDDYFLQMKSSGFDYAEISSGYSESSKTEIAEITAKADKINNILKNRDISAASFHLPFGWGWDITLDDKSIINNINTLIKNISGYGFKTLIIHTSFEPNNEHERTEKIKKANYSVGILAESAKTAGFDLAVENLPRSCIGNTSAECMDIIKGTKAGICFDINHITAESHKNFFESCKNNIIACHLSDYDGIDERHWLPGSGCIDWKGIKEGFDSIGYSSPFIFELGIVDPAELRMLPDVKYFTDI